MSERKNCAKLKEVYKLPNLLDIQLLSYAEFLQAELKQDTRNNIGLQEVFNEIFPIESFDHQVRIDFIGYSLGKPKYEVDECRRRAMTYAAPLKVRFKLTTPSEVKEQESYFGEIPLMTETGTFFINGDERVVVSQLQRSPGVSFEEELHPTGKKIFYGRVIPYYGAWL